MNQRFYALFNRYKKSKYPKKIFYVLKTKDTRESINFEYKTLVVKSELELEEKLYELCEDGNVYFDGEIEELTKKILKKK